MKLRRTITAVSVCSALLLTACGTADDPDVTEPLTTYVTSVSAPADENVVYNNQAAMANADGAARYAPEPFSSYTFDFSDGTNKYMVTVGLNSTGDAFNLTLEDSNFGFSQYCITAPENYTLNIPCSQEEASSVCSVIKNTIDDTPVPDILEFTFYLNNFEDESLPYSVMKYYSVKNDELCEIELYDTEKVTEVTVPGGGAAAFSRAAVDLFALGAPSKLEYCTDGTLLHTEPLVFMPYPDVSIDKDKNGGWTVNADIYVYRFDPVKMTMKKELQPSSYKESPLYFGYKAHAVADYIARYFTVASLNVSDYNNYVELPSVNSDTNDYYFKVDDPRFGTVDELKDFVRCFFTEKLVSDMFINAPQKYRDIDGSLYTIVGDGGYDFTLGKLTITDYKADKTSVTYHTKQEKFNDEGKFVNYIDGGDFSVELKDDGSIFITQYRFSY